MKKQLKFKLYPLLPLFISILIILASAGLFYYIQGYRFNFETQELSNTGILTIDTEPSRSELYIDDEYYGKTPKSITLKGGEYTIRIEKEGYYNWEKTVTVTEGISIPIYPWLISTDIETDNVFSSSDTFDKNHLYQNDNSIFFTLYTDIENIRRYTIYKLSTDLSAWDFTENPKDILEFEVSLESEISFNVLPSPDSSKIVFTINIDEVKERYIIETDTSNNLTNLDPITLNGFSEYSISWNNSNDSLTLESDTDILSYDIDSEIKYLIIKKFPDNLYSFTTDSSGLIYLMEGTQNDKLYTYTLYQYQKDGTLQKELLSNTYFYISDNYIDNYRETEDEFSLPFTNSQESTKTSGKILSFEVYDDINGMFIQTEYAGYWYDLDSSKFILISPYNTASIILSPLENTLLFQNGKEIGILVFAIEEGDPTQYIGRREVWEIESNNIENLQWISNGKNIIFEEDSLLYIGNPDGVNISEIYSTNELLFTSTLENPSDIYLSYVSDDEIFFIDKISIH